MNPLKRWQASVEATDKFYAQLAEQEASVKEYLPKALELMDAWRDSGFTTEAFIPLREWIQKRTDDLNRPAFTNWENSAGRAVIEQTATRTAGRSTFFMAERFK